MKSPLLNKGRGWIAAIAAVLLAATIGVWMLMRDSGSGPELREPDWVTVIVGPQLKSNQEFSIWYELRDPGADPMHLRPPVALKLWRGDKELNNLLAVDNPRIQPPGKASIPLIQLRGPGPIEFILPPLRPGRYTLCGGIGRQEENERYKFEPFCRSVEVV